MPSTTTTAMRVVGPLLVVGFGWFTKMSSAQSMEPIHAAELEAKKAAEQLAKATAPQPSASTVTISVVGQTPPATPAASAATPPVVPAPATPPATLPVAATAIDGGGKVSSGAVVKFEAPQQQVPASANPAPTTPSTNPDAGVAAPAGAVVSVPGTTSAAAANSTTVVTTVVKFEPVGKPTAAAAAAAGPVTQSANLTAPAVAEAAAVVPPPAAPPVLQPPIAGEKVQEQKAVWPGVATREDVNLLTVIWIWAVEIFRNVPVILAFLMVLFVGSRDTKKLKEDPWLLFRNPNMLLPTKDPLAEKPFHHPGKNWDMETYGADGVRNSFAL